MELGAQRAREMGMRPYYLYRQKMVAGNLENVAYALPGCESIYNIDIIEESGAHPRPGGGRDFQSGFSRKRRASSARRTWATSGITSPVWTR